MEEDNEKLVDDFEMGENNEGLIHDPEITEAITDTLDDFDNTMPHVLIVGGENFETKSKMTYMINGGHFLIKGGVIYGQMRVGRDPGFPYEFFDRDNKIIDKGNFEIEHATITTVGDKIEINMRGIIYDNDGDNSIEKGDPLYKKVFTGTLTNVRKGGYEGRIIYWPEEERNKPDYKEAISELSQEEIYENTTAILYFEEADLLIGGEYYNNDTFKELTQSAIGENFTKTAKLTKDHQLITDFKKNSVLGRKTTNIKALCFAFALGIFIAGSAPALINMITNFNKQTTIPELPGKIKSQNGALIPDLTKKSYANELSGQVPKLTISKEINSKSYEGIITIESGIGFGKNVEKYVRDNGLDNISNLKEYINDNGKKYNSIISKVFPGQKLKIFLQRNNQSTWDIVDVKKV